MIWLMAELFGFYESLDMLREALSFLVQALSSEL